jgi:hypothetical protein
MIGFPIFIGISITYWENQYNIIYWKIPLIGRNNFIEVQGIFPTFSIIISMYIQYCTQLDKSEMIVDSERRRRGAFSLCKLEAPPARLYKVLRIGLPPYVLSGRRDNNYGRAACHAQQKRQKPVYLCDLCSAHFYIDTVQNIEDTRNIRTSLFFFAGAQNTKQDPRKSISFKKCSTVPSKCYPESGCKSIISIRSRRGEEHRYILIARISPTVNP